MQCVFKQHFPVLSLLIYNHNNFAININLIKCMFGEYRGSNVVAYKLVEPSAYFPEHLRRTLCCCCKILFHRQSSWELIYVSRPFSSVLCSKISVSHQFTTMSCVALILVNRKWKYVNLSCFVLYSCLKLAIKHGNTFIYEFIFFHLRW